MTTLKNRFAMRSLAAALQGALAAIAIIPGANAADASDELTELTQPASEVQVGGLYVNKDSAKFGEYNGLDKKGGYFLGNFWLYGGNGDEGAFRWRVFGADLGLDTRNVQGEVGEQGRWRVSAGYDELTRNYSDSYLTLWRDAGSTALTLPAGYPEASTRLSVTNSAGGILANWNNIQSPNATASTTGNGPATVIPAAMQPFDVGTDRKKANLGASVILGSGWEFKASVKREDKDGTKLTGVNIGRFSGLSSILPEPISSTTDQFEASLGFVGKQGHFSVGYYGSIYKNDVNLWTVENAGANNAVIGNVARLMGAPDSEMHQFNVAGGYRFSPVTKLVVSGSYARLTQNEDFIDKPVGSTWVYPDASAHAKVINTQFLARLTSRPMRDWNFTAAYKFDERDNRTPVVNFLTTGGDAPGNSTQFSNEPINRKLHQANLEAERSLGRGQALRGEFEYQQIERSSTAEESPFRADKTYENTLRLEYRRTLAEELTGRFAYAHSRRRVSEYEEGNPRPSSPPAPLPAADPLLGGFEQFFLADRDRDKLRSSVNFQASERLSLQAGLDYNRDRYPVTYGLKESRSWVASLDAALVASEALVFNAFYTYENMKVRLDSLAIARGLTTSTLVPHVSGPPCAAYTNVSGQLPEDYFTDPCRQWSETQADKIHTLGIGARYAGLMGGKLILAGELTYAHAKTPISVIGGTYYGIGVPGSATGNVFVPAESFPDITSKMTDLKLVGTYSLTKVSAVQLAYRYRRLTSSDWAYDAYANSILGVLAVQNYIGPGLTSPNYNVNVIGVSYIYRFR